MNLLAISISIIIHALIIMSVYYAGFENQSGNKVTKVAGVDTFVGTKINIKMVAENNPTTLTEKVAKKVTPVANALKSNTTLKTSSLVTKSKTDIGFNKREVNNTPVTKKDSKPPVKTKKTTQPHTEVLKNPKIVKALKVKKQKKTLDTKTSNTLTKTNKVINKKPKDQTIQVQKGVRHTGDNVSKNQINTGNSNDTKTPWNQYKSSIFSAINAQKTYPKQAKLRRAEGTVVVKFDITKLGNISRFTLIQKVRSEHLNRSTMRLFDQLYLPKRPESVIEHLPATLTVPIEYSLN